MYNTIWAYLWDLYDDGIADSVRYLRNEVGLDAVSVATAYHTFQQLRPHRSGPKLMTADTAAVYFRPDASLYEGIPIRPRVAALARDANAMEELANSCAAEGLDLIAWTVCLHNSHLATTYPQYAQQTAYGDNLGWVLCPGEDAVRSYIKALGTDLVRNYGAKRIELESCNFGGYGHAHYHVKDGVDLGEVGRYLYSLCFSQGCVDKAGDRGIDAEGLRAWVKEQLDEVFASGRPLEGDIASFVAGHDKLAAFQEMREELVTSLVGEIKSSSGAEQVAKMIFDLKGDRWTSGVRPEKVAEQCDLLETLAYTASPAVVEEQVKNALEVISSPERVVLGLQAYHPCADSAESLAAVVERAKQCGIEQLSFYNYGIMPRPNLDWIRRSIQNG